MKEEVKKLLELIALMIRNDPRRITMSKGWTVPDAPLKPECGVVGCIGGWIVELAYGGTENMTQRDIGILAKRFLDLPEDRANALFNVSLWPEQFRSGAQRVRGCYPVQTQPYANAVAERVEFFGMTGGTDKI